MSRSSKDRRNTNESSTLDWSEVCCGACPWPANEDDETQPYCSNREGLVDVDRLARAYALDNKKSEEFPDGTKWAFNCVFSMAYDHPKHCLEIIRRAALATTTQWQRTMIGCGNLESLLGEHGAKIIGDVERIARDNPAFRECLSHVWQHGMPDEIWRRVLVASGRELPEGR